MGWFGELARRAPGVLAQHQAGKLKGEATRYDRDREEQEFQARARAEAIQQALMERRQAGEDALRPFRERLLKAQTSDAEAQAAGTGRYAPKPVVAEAPKLQHVTGPDGRAYSFNPDTGEYAPAKGVGQKPVGTGTPKGKTLPSSAIRDVNEWRALKDSAKDALDAFATIPAGQNVTGGIVGRVAGVLGQFGKGTGDKGINSPVALAARSKLSNISTALGKLRSGGAITPQEYERLESMIPNKNEDEAVIGPKLVELHSYLDRVLSRNLETYEESGYSTEGVAGHRNQPAAGSPAEDDDAWAAQHLAKRRAARGGK